MTSERDILMGKALQLKLGIGRKKNGEFLTGTEGGLETRELSHERIAPNQDKDMVSLTCCVLCTPSLSGVTPAEHWEHFHLPYLHGFQIRF